MTKLLYQEDAYLRSVEARVLESSPREGGFEVVLSETVLHPEGGGQPSDRGTVGGQKVKDLFLGRNGSVVHLLEGPVNGRVTVEVDWSRRYDHMQQHTAQHMITAVASERFGLNTTAFHLGRDRSDIELDRWDLSSEQIGAIEEQVNEHIRAALPVTTRFVDPSYLERNRVRTRGLPQGHSGQVRLLEIAGVDLNTCGGTHVANTAELQIIKILQRENMRGGTRIYFVAGGRALRLLGDLLQREQMLTGWLSCGPEKHAAAVARLLEGGRSQERERRRFQREIAGFIGRELSRRDGVADYHKPDGDMDFLRAVATEARRKDPEQLALLTAGERDGVFLLLGPEEKVKAYGPVVARILHGRGGGKAGLFQGKTDRLDQRGEALAFLRSVL